MPYTFWIGGGGSMRRAALSLGCPRISVGLWGGTDDAQCTGLLGCEKAQL